MSFDLKPYPEYRDSGLPWLGKIPAHWQIVRNGRLFSQRNETGYPDLPILEVSLKTGVRIRDFTDSNRKQVMANRGGYKKAAKGDIAYNMMRMWQGAVGVAPVDGLVSPAYVVAKPFPEIDSKYYAYLFRTTTYMNEVNKYSHGIVTDRNRLYWDEFKQMPSVFPTLSEQTEIANFLDYSARQVRAFIRTKQRVIEHLKEQKQAVIQRAVTRGIEPNVRLSPSGISWIGDIPVGWELRRLKYLVTNVNDQTGDRDVTEAYIRLEDVESWTGRIRLPEGPVEFESQVKRFKAGDILFGKLRPYLAKITRPHFNGVCVGEFLVLRQHAFEISPDFLEVKLRSPQIIDLVNSSTFGAKMPRAEWSFIGNLYICFPPIPLEHQKILRKIEEDTRQLQNAIDGASKQIEVLREYRARLIAEILTGKLDVRKSQLPALEETMAEGVLSGEPGISGDYIEEKVEPELVEETVDADE